MSVVCAYVRMCVCMYVQHAHEDMLSLGKWILAAGSVP